MRARRIGTMKTRGEESKFYPRFLPFDEDFVPCRSVATSTGAIGYEFEVYVFVGGEGALSVIQSPKTLQPVAFITMLLTK
jgi:hypothetical protein